MIITQYFPTNKEKVRKAIKILLKIVNKAYKFKIYCNEKLQVN